MITIAIDPGVHKCACAAFREGVLCEVWFETAIGHAPTRRDASAPTPEPRAAQPLRLEPVHVVVEMPEYQGARSSKSRTQDLLALSWHGAMLAGQFAGRDAAPVFAYTPSTWKGSTPKPMHHLHLWRVLSDAERHLLGGARTLAAIDKACTKGALSRWSKPGVTYYPRSFTMHNLLDAVALGCYHLGRFQLGGRQ